jgi:hypothetical protein
VSTYLFEVPSELSASPTTDPGSAGLIALASTSAISTDPDSGREATQGNIAADPNKTGCRPTIDLQTPPTAGPGNTNLPSTVNFPPGSKDSSKKYYAVTCYRVSTSYTVAATLPSGTGIICSFAKDSNGNYELSGTPNGSTVTVNFNHTACSADHYYVSTYLFEVSSPLSASATADPGITGLANLATTLSISYDPRSGNARQGDTLPSGSPSCTQQSPNILPPPPPPPPTEPPLPEPTPNTPVEVLPPYTPVGKCADASFCTTVDPKKESLFPSITSNQGRFVASAGLVMLPPGIPTGYTLAFPNTSIPQFKGKALFSLNNTGNGIIVTSDSGWTGFLHINGIAVPPKTAALRSKLPFANATNNTGIAGIAFALDIQIYPDPSPKGTYKNLDNKTVVTWDKSPTPTVIGYELYINGVKICTTKVPTTTCTIDKLIGPRSTMTVVAIGGAKTRSVEMKPTYQAAKYALALVVHYDTAKAVLKPADIKALDILVDFVKREGYKNVYVVGHTDPRLQVVNLTLSKARAQSVIAYLAPKLKGVTFSGTGMADKVPFSTGKGNLSLALNRRSDVFVK